MFPAYLTPPILPLTRTQRRGPPRTVAAGPGEILAMAPANEEQRPFSAVNTCVIMQAQERKGLYEERKELYEERKEFTHMYIYIYIYVYAHTY